MTSETPTVYVAGHGIDASRFTCLRLTFDEDNNPRASSSRLPVQRQGNLQDYTDCPRDSSCAICWSWRGWRSRRSRRTSSRRGIR